MAHSHKNLDQGQESAGSLEKTVVLSLLGLELGNNVDMHS
jgi:hypothetical protein